MSKSKILIVEDDGVVAMDIENRLKNFGYDVCAKVSYAEKAIEKAEELGPDLVIMDIVLKGDMDGIKAGKIIQSRFGLPVVFVTAHADEQRFERAKVISPFGYILKPFRNRELKITIEMALYKSRVDAKRRKAEKELKKSEERFRQAQKMESVGRLAGGVAHDYNNALSVIMGFTELALEKTDPKEPLHADLTEILKAAMHAADITRQLLAFARKQTIAPRVLDFNKTVEGMLKMLRRLIGEDISFTWMPGGGLWPIKMDPSQIDQVLANLCVNARDAIKGVGRLIIETGNIVLDKDYCMDHEGFVPGEFILLSVSDNGCGMDREILNDIFEPFFTTKDGDKGTGLGLSTVYGIVKQNKGFINVYSEAGKGTTIKIYLPRHGVEFAPIRKKNMPEINPGHGETILVVEDEPSVLKLTKKILKELGYNLLIAGAPEQALNIVKKYKGESHLIVTDIIMPGMNGPELARKLQTFNPGLKVVFMSGHTANTISHHGVLDEKVCFIQKPFSRRDLAKIVKKALDDQ
ncbi:MAG: response regulator [Desulfobacula sp.]|nr:response regulator [Desulfobacula sp.]